MDLMFALVKANNLCRPLCAGGEYGVTCPQIKMHAAVARNLEQGAM